MNGEERSMFSVHKTPTIDTSIMKKFRSLTPLLTIIVQKAMCVYVCSDLTQEDGRIKQFSKCCWIIYEKDFANNRI